jgi:hypothetical protein
MKLISQRRMPICMLCSFAMLVDITVEEATALIGHDGTAIIHPDLTGNGRFRGIHPQEIKYAALDFGIVLFEIERYPRICSCDDSSKIVDVYKRRLR